MSRSNVSHETFSSTMAAISGVSDDSRLLATFSVMASSLYHGEDLFIDAALAEELNGDERVLFVVRVALPVEIVEQAAELPAVFLVGLVDVRVTSHARGDAFGVDAQRGIGDPFFDEPARFIER